jgi:twinkle protein
MAHAENAGSKSAGPEFVSKYYQPRKSEIMDFLYSHQQRPVPTANNSAVIANCPHCMKVKRHSFAAHIDLQHGNYSCRTCHTKGSWQEYIKAFRKKKGDNFATLSTSDIRGDRKSARFSRPMAEIEAYTKQLEQNPSILDDICFDTRLTKETLKAYRVGLSDYASPESKLAASENAETSNTQCITYPQTALSYGDNQEFTVETTRLKACRVDNVQQPVAFDPVAPIATGLFGYHVAPAEAQAAIITRNELDAMSAYQATGIPSVSLPTSVYQLPQSVLPLLERFSKIYLWLDDDVDGQLAAETFAHKLGESRCLIVNTRMGDAQGPLNAHQALLQNKDLNDILSKASILKHDQIIDFHELRDEVYREFLSPDQAKGVQSTDLPALNAVLKGHRPGELTILTGPTGVGKTTIISQLSLDYCKSGVTTLWGSFEILNKRLAKKMLCQFAGKDLSKVPNEFDVWADKFEQVL